MIKLALVGAGAWGKNLLRVAQQTPGAELAAVVDPDPHARAVAEARAPQVRVFETLDQALAMPLDAALIATPATTHTRLALSALVAGLDVLVEKPLASSAAESQLVADAALHLRRVAMVGHLLRYHPAVCRLLDEVQRGTIGQPLELRTRRLSPPGRPSDVSALWALAPHDVSLLMALDPRPPTSLAAHCEPERAELRATTPTLSFRASFSRLHHHKERVITVAGTEGALTFDELDAASPLTLLRPHAAPQSLPYPADEPLAAEVAHFVSCVARREPPRTPASDGVMVARWLEAAESCRLKTPRDAGLAEPHAEPGLHR